MTTSRLGTLLLVLVAAYGCTNLDSATNLNTDGPPMVQQVRMKEVSIDASGAEDIKNVFAFGTHDDAVSGDYPALGANTMITATPTQQKLRIIMDELLVGNFLEEIACRAPVDDDAYDRVPLGTTPDDVAKCSAAKDVLPKLCPGSNEHSVCICHIEGGCGDTPEGGPVGVLDVNQDGAADDTRFIEGAVGLHCNDIDVPIDINNSYWNPSGNQNKPAMGGFDALGPAIVLQPTTRTTPPVNALPTNTTCQLTFSPDVTDKENNQVCAPPGGDVKKDCPGTADVSAFQFMVQALTVSNSSFNDGDTGIDATQPIILVANAPISMPTLSAITMKKGTTAYTGFAVAQPQAQTIRLTFTTPPTANTMYTISIATTLTDVYGQPLPAALSWTFTTAP